MNTLIPEILTELENGHPFALATTLTHHGSTPRSAGAAMVVRLDGTIAGTIGGGQIEAKTIQLASQVLIEKRPARKEFYMTGKDAASTDMICGGNQEILVEYIDPSDKNWIRQYKSIANAIHSRERAWSVTRLPDPVGSSEINHHAVIQADGENDIPAELNITVTPPAFINTLPVMVLAGRPIDLATIRTTQIVSSQDVQYLIDPIDINGTVYLFGGGHVSLQVAIAAKGIGFRVVVLDDRPEFVTQARFPMADELILLPAFANCFDSIQLDPNSYLVIVTRGHLHDQVVLAQALRTDAMYIGMIGSKRKCQTIFQSLQEEGFSHQQLDSVHAPIGLEINAESPEEIAISIAAELIQVRAKLMK